MQALPANMGVYPVHHLPIVKAYADQLGLVDMINQFVPTEMEVAPGTIVLGMILDTFSGRSPLYRLQDYLAQRDTALLMGRALSADVCNDDTVCRLLGHLYDTGPMKVLTAGTVRAAQVFGLDTRYVHFDTTSVSVYGEYLPAAGPQDQETPFTLTYGYSKDTRPDLKQFILATLCVDRAVPIWGRSEDGNASDTTINTTILSEIASLLAQHGGQPGAYISVADAALVTEDNLAALGETFFVSWLPATYHECGRAIAEAVTQENWEEVGVLAHTKPPKHRPGTSYKVAEGAVSLYRQPYRAVVVQSSTQDQRRLKRLEREVRAS